LLAKTINAIKNISTIANLCKLNLSKNSNSKIFKIIFINGIMKPNKIISADRSTSPFINRSLVIEITENSELKNQNSLVRTKGR
jgi:hypothetical protein